MKNLKKKVIGTILIGVCNNDIVRVIDVYRNKDNILSVLLRDIETNEFFEMSARELLT